MALIGLSACGEDQDPWCDQLEEWSGLDTLSQAIESGDATTAAEELDGFQELSESAPDEVRNDMEAVADALRSAVDITLDSDSADPDDLELRREELNERLGRLAAELQSISSFAETECGVRLNP
ncbi:MAG: hypothetical protein R2714_03210 [Microthrixaceae bacterium]